MPESPSYLSIAGRDVFTDLDGRYALEGVPAGEHWLQGPDFINPVRSLRVVIPPGKKEVEFNWNFPLCRFRGRILEAGERRPIEGARLDVHSEVPGGFSFDERLRAAPDGSFPIADGLPWSSGRYLLVAGAPGFERQVEERTIGEEAPAYLDFEFHLERARSSLALSLETETREAIPPDGLDIVLMPERFELEPTGDSSPDGATYNWYGLQPGRYTIAVDAWRVPRRRLGFAYAEVEVPRQGGALEQRVTLPPGGELLIEVRDASGRRFADPHPRIRLVRPDGAPAAPPSRLKNSQGRYGDRRVLERSVGPGATLFLEALPVGLYQASATRPGFQSVSGEVDVKRGQRAELVLVLSR